MTAHDVQGHATALNHRLRAEALVPCAWCGVEGPKNRLEEHYRVDHRVRDAKGDRKFIVAIPSRFRDKALAIQEQCGLSLGAIIGLALDQAFGTPPEFV